ncbi:MAG: YggT family protein [Gammaproteobacteria bacterium]|nr:YggT family protein [Gammaproteobacteria bacterium]MBI5616376.1 YggT family protein [Gammaproteobacteria bacterium]
MSGGYLSNALVFLLNTVFGLYIGAVMLRLILQLVRADFYNPLCQAIVKVTNPLVRPLRRYIPAVGRIDSSSVLLLVVLQIINTCLLMLLVGHSIRPPGLLVLAIAELLSKGIYLYIFGIFIAVVASWIAPGTYNPVLGVVESVIAPLLRPVRRRLPTLGGLDLSPLVVLLGLQLVLILVVAPLKDLGVALI